MAEQKSAYSSQPLKLFGHLRQALRACHYSRCTKQSYCHWVKRFIFFSHICHRADMAEAEINTFLTHLAVRERISALTPPPKVFIEL